MYSYWF